MHGHPDVVIVKCEKVKNARDEWWYRFTGTMDGKVIRDSVEMTVAQVESMGMAAAQASAKRSLRGLAAYLEEQANA